jgi:hypothetical protein
VAISTKLKGLSTMKILVATDGSAFSEWAQRDMLRAGLPQPFDAIVLSSANLLIPPAQIGRHQLK